MGDAMTGAPVVLLFAGMLACLAAVTALAYALRDRIAPDRSNTGIEALVARVLGWWTMVFFLGVALLAGRTVVVLLFAVLSFAALREFLTLTTKNRADHWSLLAAFFVVLPFQYYLIWVDWYGLYSIFVPVYVFLLLPILTVLRGDPDAILIRISETQFALMICVFCASHVPALLTLDIAGYAGRGVLLVAWLVIVVQSSDLLQYAWGKRIGRHVIAPRISRSKSWEGMAAGVLSAALIGTGLFWITPFAPGEAFGVALMVTLVGSFGSLVMSAIKRDRGIKDWGHLMIGQGGFIDKLDSVVFAAPVFFHLTRYGWVG